MNDATPIRPTRNVELGASDEPFQNLHEFIRKARVNVNQNAWDYIVGAAETETTMRRNRMALDEIAPNQPAFALTDAEKDGLNRAWHRLNVWPDFPAVLPQLRERFEVVVLTVMSWSIVVDSSKRGGLSWDGVLSCGDPPLQVIAGLRARTPQESCITGFKQVACGYHCTAGQSVVRCSLTPEGQCIVQRGTVTCIDGDVEIG